MGRLVGVTKIFGFIPARMKAYRFPGKPLAKINGVPMLEHVVERAAKYSRWERLTIATCDDEIVAFAEAKGYPVVMTSRAHKRATDRVAEAAERADPHGDDLIVCVQGDEPMVTDDLIEAVVEPFWDDPDVHATVLALPIVDEDVYRDPDVLKIVHDLAGDVLYTSRAPIPWCEKFSPDVGAKRIGGVFGYRASFLANFVRWAQTPLEVSESCDINRICGAGIRQRVVEVTYRPYFSVDRPKDIARVEAAI